MTKRRRRRRERGTAAPLAVEQGSTAPPAACASCPRLRHVFIMAAFPATPAALFSGHFTFQKKKRYSTIAYLLFLSLFSSPVPEFIDPRFRENKPKTLVFSHRKRAFWACFRENCVYNFGHRLGG
jgi:hypothetical protein